MRTRTLLFLPLLCSLSCSPAGRDAVDAESRIEDEAAVRALTTRFDAATSSRDIEAMMSRYADGAARMDPNLPTMIGHDAIRASFVEGWETNDPDVANELVDLRISGDLAMSRGTWTATIRPASGEEPYEDQGKWAAAAERQADGSWKSIWEIWSSDLPPRTSP